MDYDARHLPTFIYFRNDQVLSCCSEGKQAKKLLRTMYKAYAVSIRKAPTVFSALRVFSP